MPDVDACVAQKVHDVSVHVKWSVKNADVRVTCSAFSGVSVQYV